jgi:hypothetical protein
MAPAVETSIALYLQAAEPAMTALSARSAEWLNILMLPPRPLGEDILGDVIAASNVFLDRAVSGTRSYAPPHLQNEQSTVATAGSEVAEAPRTHADNTVSQLIRFGHLSADWDGNGAAKPIEESLNDARIFVRSLAPESVVPMAALHADGHAVLLIKTDDAYAELEFLGGKAVGFYARKGNREWGDEFSVIGSTLPDELSLVGFALDR